MATPIPENRAALSLGEIALATSARVSPGQRQAVCGVTTDSRGDVKDKLFVALAGESFDGHAFVRAAAEHGASAVMIERDVDVPDGVGVVRVESTLTALGALARVHRRRWGGVLVAVGGSAGKTTTKTAIAAALGAACPGAVHFSAGNLNNLVGVPMVLLELRPEHAVCVVEVGTNQRGEVARLASVCEPDIAVLTLIGVEHAAGIGDIDAIEAEEGDLLRSLGAAGTAIGNADDDRVRRQLEACAATTKQSYGTRPGSSYRVLSREARGLEGVHVVIERPGGDRLALDAPLVGLPGALATAAAVAVADRVAKTPLAEAELGRALLAMHSEPGRLRPIELADGTVLIDDTYNANPASVLCSVAAARELAAARGARLLLVVGEMRELGQASESEHAAVGRELAASGAAALIAIGGDAAGYVSAVEGQIDCEFAADAALAIPAVRARVRPGDVVLVKASRGLRAERVIDALNRGKGEP